MDWTQWEQDAVITRRMVEEMDEEALLELVRRHAKLLGERFPKRAEDFFAPEISDMPHLLRRLYRLDPERFREMTAEQCQREYIAGGYWAAVLLGEGGALPQGVLPRLERYMPRSLVRVEERTLPRAGGLYTEVREYDMGLDSALFWEVSEAAQALWRSSDAAQAAGPGYSCHYRRTRCGQLSKALGLREEWLGVSHGDSMERLYQLGWKPVDVMLSYLTGAADSTYFAPVDPDCAAEAARRDRETAAALLDPDSYESYFQGQFHPSYYMDMARAWTELLYLHGVWRDTAPLERGHRLKKMAAFYARTLEQLRQPLWARRELERGLTAAGLLPGGAALDWDSPRLAKKKRLALTRALVCHYQWRLDELRAALAASGRAETFTGLLWGVYEEDCLVTAFLLDDGGRAWGEDGGELTLPPAAQVGLATPSELGREPLRLWRKRLKETGAKPLIRQLSLPGEAPDFGIFADAATKNIALFTVSGKWGMEMPPQPSHCCWDLLDPLRRLGARLWVQRAWSGPEYAGEQVVIRGVDFYRMDGAPFGDYIPRRAIVSPAEVPARFAVLAGAAFRQMAGMK